MDRTAAERQQELRKRRKERGEVQVLVWVHETNKEKIKKIARDLLRPSSSD